MVIYFETPDSCRWCGAKRQTHYRRWHPVAGWHVWVEPTDSQRLYRMRARRAEAGRA